MVHFEQKIDSLVLAVLTNVERDNNVNQIEQVIGGLRRLRLRPRHPFLPQLAPQGTHVAVTCRALS